MAHERNLIVWFLTLGIVGESMADTTGVTLKNTTILTKNLTDITWAHAVNSQKELDDALNNDIDMIEADIVLGKLNNAGANIPVMGHPPANTSDITLQTFLTTILDYNRRNANNPKGVKLDFKSTEVFEGSLEILNNLWDEMDYPIWLNADIISGPVENTATIPVDPDRFFAGCRQFNDAVLSIGWTTRWGSNFTDGTYTDNQLNAMIQSIQNNNVSQNITYPVRAGIAANSKAQLHQLIAAVNGTNDCTLTIWSSPGDYVNIERLRDLIFSFGLDRVYLDVPEEVSSKLNLSNKGSVSAISTFANFGFISVFMLITSFVLQRTEI